jgi:PleD family two-component response regulator
VRELHGSGKLRPIKLHVKVSIGFAERLPGETMKALVDRADAEMYRDKAASRKSKINACGWHGRCLRLCYRQY